MHEVLTRAINDTIKGSKNNPYMVNTCNHFLLSKGKDTKDSKNYRLFTCLPTIYRVIEKDGRDLKPL